MHNTRLALWGWLALFTCTGPVLGHELGAVEVIGHYDHSPGASDAASQGAVGADALQSRPLVRPGEALEAIPGLVVTQHSGEGKANQYFVRGINLDHGTDFATSINGVPINLPTHAHGQGYTDLNVLIPELVRRIDYRKGPYDASHGDFASAGSAQFVYRTQIDRPFADVTVGQFGYRRGVTAASRELGSVRSEGSVGNAGQGLTLLTAFEHTQNNGPWTVPEGLRKNNAQFILSDGSARQGWSLSLSAYAAHWRATDQVPQRLIDAGATPTGQPFGRFDSLDPSDGASTRRTSLSGMWHRATDLDRIQIEGYVLSYDLDVFSNFTYSLRRASDQFAQTDHRTVWGGKAQHTWLGEWPSGRDVQHTLGVQWRQDRMQLGLYDAQGGLMQAAVREDAVLQSSAAVYGESEVTWFPGWRTVLGARADQVDARVRQVAPQANVGSTRAAQVSPKFSLILGPWWQTEFFANAGRGFHSNDARGTLASAQVPAQATVPLLVSTRGHEVGLKSQPLPRWQTTLAVWRLEMDSEWVYVGDAGTTQAGRPSRRTGVEWTHHWTPTDRLWFDANLAWTRPRYLDPDPQGAEIVNAVQRVAHLSAAWRAWGPWSGALTWRYVGAAPLATDNRVRSPASATLNARLQRSLSRDVDLALDVLNLANRQNNDIAYLYTSRVVGEPVAGVEGMHVHPALPRTYRVTAKMRF
jgi:hypothetical protein